MAGVRVRLMCSSQNSPVCSLCRRGRVGIRAGPHSSEGQNSRDTNPRHDGRRYLDWRRTHGNPIPRKLTLATEPYPNPMQLNHDPQAVLTASGQLYAFGHALNGRIGLNREPFIDAAATNATTRVVRNNPSP